MIRRTGIDAALAATALMLGACSNAYFTSPLSAPGDSEPDARLEGAWQVTSPDQPAFVGYAYFVPTDNGVMDVDLISYRYKKDLEDSSPVTWARYQVFRTEIDGAWYLNVKPVAGATDIKHPEPVYFILKYDISHDGVLSIWGPSPKALLREITEGRLAGLEERYGIIVTEDAENLREYFRMGEDPFTEHILTLRKILPKVPGQ